MIVGSLGSEAGEGVVVSAGSSVSFRCHTDDQFSESDVSVHYLSALAAFVLFVCGENCGWKTPVQTPSFILFISNREITQNR